MNANNLIIFENIHKAIFDYDKKLLEETVRESIDKDLDPLEVFNEMMKSIRKIGKLYNEDKLFLPELIGASDTMQHVIPLLEEQMQLKGKKKGGEGVVVIGTVFGDIHCIGKNMVCTLLRSEGFSVIDLGVNVSSDNFVEAIRKNNPALLAMSALLTTTMNEQKKVISFLEKENIREKVKVIVGGAPVTEMFAKEIGADGYAPTAPGAVTISKILLNKKEDNLYVS
jgi:corrinoid protein of di/trimethylamine methyltransferase